MSTVIQTPMQPKLVKRKKARSRLKPMSDKRKELSRIYTIAKRFMLKRRPICEAQIGCFNASEDVHHTKGRVGNNYLDVTTWKMVCRSCHTLIHQNPAWAREKGLLQ